MILRSILLERKHTILHRFFPPVNNIRRKIPLHNLIHQPAERMIQMYPRRLIQRLRCITPVDRSPETDLLRNNRTDSSKRRVNSPGNITWLPAHNIIELLLTHSQRIQLILRLRNKILPSRKHLTHRTHMRRNMLDTIQDHPLIITENNITVLAHQLHDKNLLTGIPQLIQMLQLKHHHTLHPRLPDIRNPRTSNMLTQQHTEIRRSHRTGLILRSKINQRKRSTGRKQQPALPIRPLPRNQKLIRLRLSNLIKPSSIQIQMQLLHHSRNRNPIKSHIKTLLFK